MKREPAACCLNGIRQQAVDILENNVLNFWTEHAIDEEFGGFYTNLDRAGNHLPDGTKRLLMQVRTIWSFSAAHRHGLTENGYLERAKDGIDFVEKNYRDEEYGGYYFACDRQGTPIDLSKRTYHLSFLIYAYAEYYLASGDKDVLALAEAAFELIQNKALEPDGTYFEDFDRQWNRLYINSLNDLENVKTLNTHMHLLESFTTLVQATGKEKHRKALMNVYQLILKKSIDPEMGFAYEPYDLKFDPVLSESRNDWNTSYSHNVELAWLLLDAADALGVPRESIKTVSLNLVDHALKYGFDWEKGGLASQGSINTPVADLNEYHWGIKKGWWEQSEMLIACLYAYQLKPDERYLDAYKLTWKWVWDHQIDHENGSWFADTDWKSGKPQNTDKGLGGWKTAYHNSRALMHMDAMTSDINAKE